jgi:hypothetical protein
MEIARIISISVRACEDRKQHGDENEVSSVDMNT